MGAKSSKAAGGARGGSQEALPELPPGAARRTRRTSVSAEVDKTPNASSEKIVIPKSPEQEKAIRDAVAKNFLFNSLLPQQLDDVVAAMAEKVAPPGEKVIKEGEAGDFFYVVSSGELDIFIPGKDEAVRRIGAGAAFGELALMYNAPRSATVQAVTECQIFALDRGTFRNTIMEAGKERRKKYEDFLQGVEILKAACLKPTEVAQLADAVAPAVFEDGEVIVEQGDADRASFKFYIIEEGSAKAFVKKDGQDIFMSLLGPGEYFGEKALLEKTARTATVKADGELKVACLDISTFERLMGPCADILKERATSDYLNPDDVRDGRVSPKGVTPAASPSGPDFGKGVTANKD